jgi:hypothetical protein
MWWKIAQSGNPGVDVMITIFWEFANFLRKKLSFYSNTNVMIKFIFDKGSCVYADTLKTYDVNFTFIKSNNKEVD